MTHVIKFLPLTGAKFAKFARDTKIVDNKTITTTDIDIFFNKAKKKDARKLDFETFKAALKLVAAKRSPSQPPAQAYQALVKHVCSKGTAGPKVSGTVSFWIREMYLRLAHEFLFLPKWKKVPQADKIVARLTDTSKYTGTHKHRFDDDGKGRGILGRDRPNPTADLSQITNREAATVTGVPLSAALQAGVRSSSNSSLSRLSSSPLVSGNKRAHDFVKSKDSLVSAKKWVSISLI